MKQVDQQNEGGRPGAVVKVACLESRRSRVRTPLWPLSFKETKCFYPAHSWILNIVGSLRDRVVACSASDRQGSNFELCVRRAVSSKTTFIFSPTKRDVRLMLSQRRRWCSNINHYSSKIFNSNFHSLAKLCFATAINNCKELKMSVICEI